MGWGRDETCFETWVSLKPRVAVQFASWGPWASYCTSEPGLVSLALRQAGVRLACFLAR